jgi:hypothetical protein
MCSVNGGKPCNCVYLRQCVCVPQASDCRMDLPGPTTSVGITTDYSVGPWDYPTCAARYLLA